MTALPRIRHSPQAALALLLMALAGNWLQNAWHKPMALAAAGNPLLADAVCGGPLSSGDIAQLVALGILPVGSDDRGAATLCDLLTVPVADTMALPVVPADALPPAVAASFPPLSAVAAAQTRLPPARAPPRALSV
ncbi:MAG: hypothetical protein ACOY9J_04410 [Pseudomonadota bacterium]